jgi:hypothetical protein
MMLSLFQVDTSLFFSTRLHVFLASPTGVLYDMLLGTKMPPTSQHAHHRLLAALCMSPRFLF